jgi:hypothetical protein
VAGYDQHRVFGMFLFREFEEVSETYRRSWRPRPFTERA